jgi:branched-chain amino acid transport system permease protein
MTMYRLRRVAATGVVFGAIAVYVAMSGLLLTLHARWIVVDRLTLAHATMLAIAFGAGHVASRNRSGVAGMASAVLSSMLAGLVLAGLAALMLSVDLRWIFIALSKPLFDLITFGGDLRSGACLLLGFGLLAGAAAAVWRRFSVAWRAPLRLATAAVIVAGTFQELIQLILQNHPSLDTLREFFYRWDGLTDRGAGCIFVAAAGLSVLSAAAGARWPRRAAPSSATKRAVRGGFMLLLLVVFPLVAGAYIGQVMLMVALYALMGMGLNLEFGLAGLLDLGFVAFFAIGAYTTALLTAESPHALAALSFWTAMPIAVLASVGVGLLFGLPVLGMRGDYLAVATMGLGEIVRVLITSDLASPILGGAQGVLQIPRPSIAGHVLDTPTQLYFVALAAALAAAYVAWRLEGSRLGRAWRAMRDDEHVAQALGIDLVRSKLLAYGLGAGFAGMAGSIFATMVTSIYPSSFQLIVSINVLALIVVGGTGSFRGVTLGAAVLIGLPELLREFGEYRYLFYGGALVLMMRWRPEGLWPARAARHEQHPPGAGLGQT